MAAGIVTKMLFLCILYWVLENNTPSRVTYWYSKEINAIISQNLENWKGLKIN